MERKRIVEDDSVETKRQPSGAAVMQTGVTEALTRSFFVEWAEQGYSAISLERVAAKAGVGKAALYRRWPSKEAMTNDLLPKVGLELSGTPDTGSLEGDIRALLHELHRLFRHSVVRRILPDLFAQTDRSTALARTAGRMGRERRQRAAVLIGRAVERGELPHSCDVELAADLIAAPLYWRLLVTRKSITAAERDRMARVIIAGLKVCY
jgi:AcrR family transcriptional regulator